MELVAYLALVFVAWFVIVVAPAARFAYEDRALPTERRRGVSILPGWPVMPILFSAPVIIAGVDHWTATLIVVAHGGLLALAAVNIVFWTVRLRARRS